MNVWKVASRWSHTGTPESSVLDIFRKYNVLFIGRQTDRASEEIEIDDIVAVSDGLKIVSVGQILEKPKPVTEYKFDEDDLELCRNQDKNFYYSNNIGFKVKLYNLDEHDIFQYTQRTFHKIHKNHEKVIALYEKYDKLGYDAQFNEKLQERFDSSLREIFGNKIPIPRSIFDCWSAEWGFTEMDEKVTAVEKLAQSNNFGMIIDDYARLQRARNRHDIVDAIPRSLAYIISQMARKNKNN